MDTQWKNLAPEIVRQRLIVEGYPSANITDEQIKDYFLKLSEVCGMKTLAEPTTHKSDMYGWAGWIHWETSGAHFYAWDQPRSFFSVDIYTCKLFSAEKAVEFTKKYFNATEIVYKEINV
jgi:S-adenosylmethionine decarboxylase